jgi:hypothetical protein
MPNINVLMTDFYCAVCNEKREMTIFAGTVLCLQCLAEIKKNNQEREKPLNDTVKQVVEYGMGDIYD